MGNLPHSASLLQKLSYLSITGKSLSIGDVYANTTLSAVFGVCPAARECKEGSDDLSYATLTYHSNGDLTNPGVLYRSGPSTMEEMEAEPDTQPEAVWFQRTDLFCGYFGGPGYRLTKVIDADGSRIEPFFSSFRDVFWNKTLIV